MPYLNTITGEYPRYPGDLEILGWEQGTPLPDGWVEVIESPRPKTIENEVSFEIPPILVEGTWRMMWDTRKLTAEEINRNHVEAIRRKVQLRQPLTEAEAALLIG